MDQLRGSLNTVGRLGGMVHGTAELSGSLKVYSGNASPPFTGDYEYIPTEDTQIIEIADKRATENITINPIPNNYGRIAWNGSTLTVY